MSLHHLSTLPSTTLCFPQDAFRWYSSASWNGFLDILASYSWRNYRLVLGVPVAIAQFYRHCYSRYGSVCFTFPNQANPNSVREVYLYMRSRCTPAALNISTLYLSVHSRLPSLFSTREKRMIAGHRRPKNVLSATRQNACSSPTLVAVRFGYSTKPFPKISAFPIFFPFAMLLFISFSFYFLHY